MNIIVYTGWLLQKKDISLFSGWFDFFSCTSLYQNSLLNHSLIIIYSFIFFCHSEIKVLHFYINYYPEHSPYTEEKNFYWWFSTMQMVLYKLLYVALKIFFFNVIIFYISSIFWIQLRNHFGIYSIAFYFL